MIVLRLLRIIEELTLDKAAKEYGIPVADLCRYEKAQMRPYPLHAKRLEDHFGRTITELLNEVNKEDFERRCRHGQNENNKESSGRHEAD